MSKHEPLWCYVKEHLDKNTTLILSFKDIEAVLSCKIDHSFLKFKKELIYYGCEVEKISLKNQTITLKKTSVV